MKKSASQAKKILKNLADDLAKPDGFAAEYAELVLQKAQSNASSRPTPQAGLVAESLSVSGNTISPAAGLPSDLSASSDYGSDIYRQFQHTHTGAGLWLLPAGEDVDVIQQADKALEQMLDDAVDGPL